MSAEYYISTDQRLLDHDFVFREIQASYWGGGRTRAQMLRAIDHSICFGLYQRGPESLADIQLGFARVVTDSATFAWICDVLVTECRRGQGLGKLLLEAVFAHPDVKPRACFLCTTDAQKLYAQFGFTPFAAMKRIPETATE
jgi:GNAT superfamily N-acetyltransferase